MINNFTQDFINDNIINIGRWDTCLSINKEIQFYIMMHGVTL